MVSAQIDVMTVGHALVDVFSAAGDSFLETEGLDKGAMHLIDADRAQSLYKLMGPGTESSGGSAANTAAGVVTCGASASFIGTVAGDQLGEVFTHDIRSAGVRYATPPVVGASTGRSLILITPDGERTMNTFIGAAERLSMQEIGEELLRNARITYVEGYLMDDRFHADDWDRVANVIHDAGNLFSVTLSDSFCVERHRSKFIDVLDGRIDICFGNEDEVQILFESDDLERCLRQLAKQCKIAAVTLGARGSVVVVGDRRIPIASEKVDVVDTTGAGDMYAAGFLTGMIKGFDAEDCGRLASRTAGAIISQVGARFLPGTEI